MIQFAWDFLPKETNKNRLTKCERARAFSEMVGVPEEGGRVCAIWLDGIVHHFFSGSNVSSRSSELNTPFLDVVWKEKNKLQTQLKRSLIRFDNNIKTDIIRLRTKYERIYVKAMEAHTGNK